MAKIQTVPLLILAALCSSVENLTNSSKSVDQKLFVTHAESTVTVELAHDHEEVVLPCNVGGNPKSTGITWKSDGESKITVNGSRFDTLKNSSLKIMQLNLDDAGKYTCEACNRVGCVNSTVTLKVYFKIDDYLQNTTQEVNSTLFYICMLMYKPLDYLEFKYYKGYLRELDNDDIPSDLNEIKNTRSNVLVKNQLTHSDAGWYTCAVSYQKCETEPKVIAFKSVHMQITDSTTSTDVLIGAILLSIPCAVLIVVITCVICICRQRKMKKQYERWIKIVKVTKNTDPDSLEGFLVPKVHIEKQRIIMVENNSYDACPVLEYEFPTEWQWEIQRERITLGKPLGEGAFGKVVLAEAFGFAEGDFSIPVAVKMLKDNHSDEDVKDLICELEIMKMIGKHPNVIGLLGCCSKDGLLYVIVEFAAHGNLKDFLHGYRLESDYDHPEKKAISNHQLISFASQIASGMEYLSSIKCIHRDLAARNILVSEGYTMKIADFGLARDVNDHEYYRKMSAGLLPLRWLAPECLEHRFFNTKTDVWSFGILLWEIMTLGDQPYEFLTAWENLLQHLKQGHRLEQPRQCPDEVYLIMKECWQYSGDQRPTFGEIVRQLEICSGRNVPEKE